MKISEEKKGVCIFLVVVLQVFLMVNSPVTNSQNIYLQTSKETYIEGARKERDLLATFFLNLISIKQMRLVSASLAEGYNDDIYLGKYKAHYNQYFSSTSGQVCCQKMKNGAICQNVPYGYSECETSLFPNSCENIDSCKAICCNEEEEGICYPNTPKGICEEYGGVAYKEANCNNEVCAQGCCIIGEKTQYTTRQRCEFLSAQKGFDFANFERGVDAVECLEKQKSQEVGACITRLGTCTFGTEADCYRVEGTFHKDKLCSHPNFESSQCERQASVGCFEGKDEIYWFDSCGNRENIYSSDRDFSWNNGFVLTKEESCGFGNSNENSESCGNCDYSLGSVCSNSRDKKIEEGDFVCRSMNCIDGYGNVRLNGESWCAHDGIIGGGNDLVGSRYWRRICQDGEVVVEPCADFRQEVCAQSTQTAKNGQEISLATCRTNRWKNCLAINNLKEENLNEGASKGVICQQDSDCMWKTIFIGDSQFDYCLPQYPPGFEFWNPESDAKEICAIASQNCTCVKDCDGCVANCDCIEMGHTRAMNDFCTNLGDCGAYYNIYLGEDDLEGIVEGWNKGTTCEHVTSFGDGGYTIKKAPRISCMKCKYRKWIELLRDMKGKEGENFPAPGNAQDYGYSNWDREGGDVKGRGGSSGMSSGTKAGIAASAGVVSAIAVYALYAGEAFLAIPVVGWVIAAVILVVVAILSFSGIFDCDVKKIKVEFKCLPWVPPSGGENCGYCNEDPLKPCSEYRCRSLGSACRILNEGTENPICFEENSGDIVSPIVSFGGVNGEGYSVNEIENGVEIKREDGQCINEFTPVSFTIKTDEYATCKINLNEHSNNYEEMEDYLGGNSFYAMEHNGTYMMMNVDYLMGLLENSEQRSELIEKIRNFDIYIRCQDNQGNYNIQEYTVRFCVKNGPDLTPPVIVASNPEDGSYIPFGKEDFDLNIFSIEPAECRYSRVAGKNYFEMEGVFNCETDIESPTDYGWQCSANIGGLKEETSNIYIKCRDQPWLELAEYAHLVEEGRKRNVNEEDFVFSVKKSKSTLNLSQISPSGYIENGYEPVTVSLSAKTSGGATGNGYASCRYNFEKEGWSAQFHETGTNNHFQKEFNLLEGEYEMKVTCKDVAGNVAEGKTKFNIKLDTKPPVITNIFKKDSRLEIKTDENAKCYFDHKTCLFNLENGTSMSSSLSKTHSAEWKVGETYYVKCVDLWGNVNQRCDKVISPDYF